jgi:hypothetical protein
MKTVTVDAEQRVSLPGVSEGETYAVESDSSRLILTRVSAPTLSKEEFLERLERSPLKFERSWEEIRKDTRGY